MRQAIGLLVLVLGGVLVLWAGAGCAMLKSGRDTAQMERTSNAPAWQQEKFSDPSWNQATTDNDAALVPPPTGEELEAWMKTAEAPGSAPAPEPAPGQPGSDATANPQAGAEREVDLESWVSPKAFAADNPVDEKYLIRTGNISIKVDEYKAGQAAVKQVAQKYSATITNSSVSKDYNGMSSGYITIRVPAERFFEAWEELQQIGEVLDASTASEDVSRQWLSAWSQLKNLTIQQETLRGMLEDAREVQRTRGLGEAYSVLLETQQRLAEVSGQIQATADLMANLKDQITRSTITINLTEKVKLEKEPFAWGFDETLGKAGMKIKYGLRDLSNGLLFFVLTAWLWIIPLALVLLVLWLIVRRFRRKKGEPSSKPVPPPAQP